MMSAPVKKIILRCFFQHKVIYLCAEFQLYLTPSTGFLPIDITFFGNIGLEYFSNQFLRVFHQSKLELSDLDEKLPKSRPLLLNIFESSNCVDRRIVHCTMSFLLQRSVNRKICQNVYLALHFHFHFLICLLFPGIPLVKTTKMSKIHNCIFQIQISP